MKHQSLLLVLSTVIVLSLSLVSNPALANADLSRMDLGSYVTGPEITNKDLKGRFVIVEYWGVNCPPCIASIPHMTELAEEYGHKRLLIVANHCQGGTEENAKQVWEKRAKSNFVAVINGGNLPGANVSGIPDAFLFDPNGKQIWRGHPTKVDKPLEQAMKSFRWSKTKDEAPAPDPIVTGVEAKYFKGQLEDINAQKRSIAAPLAQVRRAAERSSKEDQKAEAQAILDAVMQWTESQHSTIKQAKASDPAKAYTMLEQTIELLGRDELGKPFSQAKAAMDSDEAMMDEVRSMRMLREVIATAESIGMNEDAKAAKSDRKNSRDLRAITRDLGRIIDKWPNTDAGSQAKSLQSKWGL